MQSETEALRLRDWSGLSCWPVYIYDQAYPVGGTSWSGVGAAPYPAWLLRSGSVTVSTGRHETTARAGEWLIPPRQVHQSRFSADAGILSVRFHANWPDGRALLEPKRPFVLRGKSSETLTRLAVRLERFAARNFVRADTGMEWKQARAEQYLELNRHFFAWLGELVARLRDAGCPPSTPAQADERALRAAHLLNTLPLNESWTLESLARRTGLSPAHLNRLFVAAFDATPKHYHLERRKRAAARLLQEEHLPIKQVALTLGFTSACYFTAWFRVNFGIPPATWREKNRTKTPGNGPTGL